MSKVLLETVQVARHVSLLGLRPAEKMVCASAQAAEDLTVWSLKLQPVQEFVGPQHVGSILDSYFQAKEVALQSVVALRHQFGNSTMQSVAEYATVGMRQIGAEGRVVGPTDVHWDVQKVISDLRTAEVVRANKKHSSTAMQLTPRRFVFFMREAERKRRAARFRDPVEHYVEWMLQNGHTQNIGPRYLEKKLYMDVARIITFAFDRLLKGSNGLNVWGHALQVRVSMEATESVRHRANAKSAVGADQVEMLVDRMLGSEDLEVPPVLEGMQKQLLMNCTFMMLQLIEDLTSSDHLSVSVLGHALRVNLEPLPENEMWNDEGVDAPEAHSFRINNKAVDELVNALIEEPEVQLVFVPDVIEGEAYRYALHRMICIAEFVLSHLRICLFGNDVRLSLVANEVRNESSSHADEDDSTLNMTQVHVLQDDVEDLLKKIKDEETRIENELKRRQHVESDKVEADSESAVDEFDEDVDGQHQFQAMAAEDKLARCLALHKKVNVPIDLAYSMVADINMYPRWMPFCTGSRVLSEEDGKVSCEVGFGLETGTMLGAVGDTIKYRVAATEPTASEPGGLRAGRVIADTPDGFRYGKRLVYDWRFTEVSATETEVKLDMFFQAGSVWFLPLWDSMQATITGAMMQKFSERADVLRAEERGEAPGPAQSTPSADKPQEKTPE